MAKKAIKKTNVNENKGTTTITVEQKTKKGPKAAFSIKDAPFTMAMPTNFDFVDHKPIARKNFNHDKYYHEHRAVFFEFQALRCRAEAIDSAKYGSKKEQYQVKRVGKLQSQIEELTASLKEQGVDVDEFLTNMQKK